MRAAPPWRDAGGMESANSLLELSNQLAHAVELGEQAVVAVHGRPHVPSSGILWQAGVVVTTDHTLKRDEDLTVTLPDGRNLPATLAGRDPGTDLAVLRLSDDSGKSDYAAKTVSDASINPGNLVLALGRARPGRVSAPVSARSARFPGRGARGAAGRSSGSSAPTSTSISDSPAARWWMSKVPSSESTQPA